MRATVTAILSAASLALLLAACQTATGPEGAVGVEERKPGAKPGAQTGPIERKPIAGVDLTKSPKDAASPLKDPNSILSKRSIYYDFDQFDVRDQYRGMVEAHAKYLRDNPGAKVLIQGNADERGSREYNVGLGQRRSDGVKRMLLLLGAKEGQIESVSLGEEKPQAEGHSEEAWAKNRRSDILYGGEY